MAPTAELRGLIYSRLEDRRDDVFISSVLASDPPAAFGVL